MLKQIFGWVFLAVLLALIILLFWNGGGFKGIVRTARSLPSLRQLIIGTATSSRYQLPGQDSALSNIGIDLDFTGEKNADSYAAPSPSEIDAPTSLQSYGVPSPERGAVSLSIGNAFAGNASEEYVLLIASETNTAPVDVSGWSLQSVLSGTRASIPLAASPYVLGIVNPVSDTLLSPGATATFISGISPIGVSFRETICTGYLNQVQPFTPGLSNSCPASERIVPYTQQNLVHYGADCFEFLRTLAHCSFPSSVPSTLSSACRALLINTFTYNGCVNMYRGVPDFGLPSYRLYGNYTRELWGNDHDIIRLLDREGRTVDAVSY